jgi:hypothetical protein
MSSLLDSQLYYLTGLCILGSPRFDQPLYAVSEQSRSAQQNVLWPILASAALNISFFVRIPH